MFLCYFITFIVCVSVQTQTHTHTTNIIPTCVTLHVLPEVACATEGTVTDGASADGTGAERLSQFSICGGEGGQLQQLFHCNLGIPAQSGAVLFYETTQHDLQQ